MASTDSVRVVCPRCKAAFRRLTSSRRRFCDTCSPSRPRAKAMSVADLPVDREPGPIEASAVRELTAAGVLDTLAGAQVVDLARSLDAGTHTGSQRAALHDKLAKIAADARAQGKPASSGLDELRARRAARAAGA